MSPSLAELAIGGLSIAVLVLSFLLGLSLSGKAKGTSAKKAAEQAIAAAALENSQAVSEVEVIEQLSSLGISGSTLKPLADRIQTVGQLKNIVASLRASALRSAETEMFSLAAKYANEQFPSKIPNNNEISLLAKAYVFAQVAVTHRVVHPAFASISSFVLLAGPDLGKSMGEKIREQEESLQGDSSAWVHRQKLEQVHSNDEMHRLGRGYHYYSSSPRRYTYTWDVVEPAPTGMVRIRRHTGYGTYSNVHSDYIVREFDPCKNEAERKFWAETAREYIDMHVSQNYKRTEKFLSANILDWTRFLEVIESKAPAESREPQTETSATAIAESKAAAWLEAPSESS